MQANRCDFCCSIDPVKEFPCADFPLPHDPGMLSAGAWAACPPCAALVDAGDLNGLVRRCAGIHGEEQETPWFFFVPLLYPTYEMFFRLRTQPERTRK